MKLDKLREWIQMLGLVAIPIILGITGNEVAKSNATREVDARMVEIAAQVLAGPAGEITPKMFRHTYISPRIQTTHAGAPVAAFTVAREVGHSSTAMIEKVYGHLGAGPTSGQGGRVPRGAAPAGGSQVTAHFAAHGAPSSLG